MSLAGFDSTGKSASGEVPWPALLFLDDLAGGRNHIILAESLNFSIF